MEHAPALRGRGGPSDLVLVAWFLAAERRRSMKSLACSRLVAVIAQGVRGGSRDPRNSTTLAALHGVHGQAFFA